jgi:hypothetical protein
VTLILSSLLSISLCVYSINFLEAWVPVNQRVDNGERIHFMDDINGDIIILDK